MTYAESALKEDGVDEEVQQSTEAPTNCERGRSVDLVDPNLVN